VEHQFRGVTIDILLSYCMAGRLDFEAVRTILSHAGRLCRAEKFAGSEALLLFRISHFQRQENIAGLLSQQADGGFPCQPILNECDLRQVASGSNSRTRALRLKSHGVKIVSRYTNATFSARVRL
jgi:hypothetical protein